MNSQALLSILLGLAFSVTVGSEANGEQFDLIIDGPSPELTIEDVDGRPTRVLVTHGGRLAGAEVRGGSTLVIDGGVVTQPVLVSGSSSIEFNSGQIACLDTSFCPLAELIGFVGLANRAQATFRGGTFGYGLPFPTGVVTLFDESSLTVYGMDLALIQPVGQFPEVVGTYASGQNIDILVQRFNDDSTVTLINIPEPSGVLLATLTCCVAVLHQGHRRDTEERQMSHSPA